MSGHTPGPWIIDPESHWDKEIVIRQDADSWHRLRCDVDYDDCDPDTAIANARLIAASPCVLKALERLLAVCEVTTFSDAYPEECEAARAAIAKAKGGAA